MRGERGTLGGERETGGKTGVSRENKWRDVRGGRQ
jgi:hypothetical protein